MFKSEIFIYRYATTMETHMKNLVLRHMPPNLQTMDSKQTSKHHILNQLLWTKCYRLIFYPKFKESL